MPYLYHYTNHESAMEIISSKQILASEARNRDAFHGRGVYFTKLSKADGYTWAEIMLNNWGDCARFVERNRHCGDFYIRIDSSALAGVRQIPVRASDGSERDIWLYPDSIKLSGLIGRGQVVLCCLVESPSGDRRPFLFPL